MAVRSLLALFALVASAAACAPASQDHGPTAAAPAAATTTATGPPPTWDELAAASYQGMAGQTVTLAGGDWQGEPLVEGSPAVPRALLLRDLRADADLDGDGTPETYVLLSLFPGGSGELVHVAALAPREGSWRNVATLLVGDRVRIRRLGHQNGSLVLDTVEAGPDEPMCCGTRKTRRTIGWRDGNLVELAREDQGAISVADLEGVEWVLERVTFDEPVPEGVRATATFAEGAMAGSGGCNQYRAPITSSAPTAIALGPAIATRRACPQPQMQLETRFLHALESVSQFSFLGGKLALTYQGSDGPATLVFAAPSS